MIVQCPHCEAPISGKTMNEAKENFDKHMEEVHYATLAMRVLAWHNALKRASKGDNNGSRN